VQCCNYCCRSSFYSLGRWLQHKRSQVQSSKALLARGVRYSDIRDIYASITKEKGHRFVRAMLHTTQLIIIAELKELFLLT
jgi:hypothetical protein